MLFVTPTLKAPAFTVPGKYDSGSLFSSRLTILQWARFLSYPRYLPSEVPYQRKSSSRLIQSALGGDLHLMDIAHNGLVKGGGLTGVLAGKKLFP